MSDKATITPSVLKWARTTAKMTIEAAAGKIHVAPDKLSEWESGRSLPTIHQAEALAKMYHRPFALFFFPEPPLDFQPLQDFRRKTASPLSTASIFIIREIRQKQAWARAFNEENGEQSLPFVGRFSRKNSPATVARDILAELQIDPSSYRTNNPMKEWVGKAEARGIFISRTSFINTHLKLDSEELQGFVIADAFAPFVFINTEDWEAPQLFTLVHELAHIWINESGISGEVRPDEQGRHHQHPIELFCNEVAARALMPTEIINQLDASAFTAKNMYKTARAFGISSFAFLVRALDLQKISLDQYRSLKAEADRSFKEYLRKEEEKKALPKKEHSTGPDYYLIQANRNGHLFTKFVMDAYHGGFIQPTEASSLLNLAVNKFPKLAAFVYT